MFFDGSQKNLLFFLSCAFFQSHLHTMGLVFYIPLLLSLVSILIIFGDAPTFRGTIVHRARIKAVKYGRNIVNLFNHYNHRWFNNQLYRYFNWLIPILYLAVISFCLQQFFTKTFSLIPRSIQDSLPHRIYIALSIISLYSATFITIYSNPGIIHHGNSQILNLHFPPNNLIFFPGKECSTCKIVKIARSKHCSTCNHCIMLYDHHCIWINNCIGYYNYRWFLFFLASNINFLFYGGCLCFTALAHQNTTYNLGYWKLITSSTEQIEITGIFLLLCLAFVVISSIFTALHLRFLYLGVTTNESDKWGTIEHLIRIGKFYYFRDMKVYAERVFYADSPDEAFANISNDSVICDVKDSYKHDIIKINSMEEDLDNIYDHGFVNNIKERVFPINFN